jgi:hypothetical protein
MGLGTKTYWLTDRQSQCDFDFWLWLERIHNRTPNNLLRTLNLQICIFIFIFIFIVLNDLSVN